MESGRIRHGRLNVATASCNRWATVEQPAIAAHNQYEVLKPIILEHPQGERILEAFDALGDLERQADPLVSS